MAPGFVLCRCTSGNPRAMDEELEDENEEKHGDGKHVFKVFGCSRHKERYKDFRAGIGFDSLTDVIV